jgi:D-alanyl-lipoteichoic acid acyltransferase DltB (MBOAT superfamily)
VLFNSYEFIFLFLPLAFAGYFFLRKISWDIMSKSWLVLASLVFYAYWDPVYLPVILFSLFFNYSFSFLLNSKGAPRGRMRQKSWLVLGITVNIILLGYFKYYNFILWNINELFNTDFVFLELELPIGISFYTFQQIAFLVDSYRNKVEERNFLNYSMFVTFFPQLIAGPIVHHAEMMPQFGNKANRILNSENLAKGLYIFFIGLFKKVVIADTFAVWASSGFDLAPALNLAEAWATSLSYTFQLYFDFSGYTDMAIGLALMFNIYLPFNFNSPYRALNIQDFWRRWHMTLSRFLRDYVYIPLGGNRKGEAALLRNLLLTFLIGGIWHGAGWTFVFWGLLHGLAAVIHRVWGYTGIKLNRILAWLLTFAFVNAAWVFFRALNWGDAVKVLKGMAGMNGMGSISELKAIDGSSETFLWIAGAFLLIMLVKNTNKIRENFNPKWWHLLFLIAISIYSIINLHRVSEFIYFGF